MNGILPSILKRLETRKVSGEHYEVRAANATGMVDAALCKPADAAEFLDGLDAMVTSGLKMKDDVGTVVVRVSWGGHDLVIKKYRQQGMLHAVRHMIKGSRGRKAWLCGHMLMELGVATPRPLAFFEMTSGGLLAGSYIVTPYVDAPNLREYLKDEVVSQEQVIGLLRQVHDVIMRLACRGISHGDMKHSNILVTPDGPVLTDLDSVTIHRCPLMCRRQRRLDAARFMRDLNSVGAANDTLKLYSRIVCGIDDVGGGRSYGYDMMQHDGWSFVIRRGFSRDDAIAIVAGGGICADGRRYEQGYSSDTARVFLSKCSYNGTICTVYIKDSFHRSRIDSIKHVFRAGRARRAFYANLMLRDNGVASPEPLVLIEKRIGPFCSESVIVTEGVDEAIAPSTYLKGLQIAAGRADIKVKRVLLRELGAMIGRMHSHGIFHGDLRHDNVLLQPRPGRWNMYLIDNERTRQFWRIPERLRLKNLVQLNMTGYAITRTDRVRFLAEYAKAACLLPDEKRHIVARVVPLTVRRLRIREEHHAND
jgi:tRNA A-37 threonylcarbamoyl transferase component Bud32